MTYPPGNNSESSTDIYPSDIEPKLSPDPKQELAECLARFWELQREYVSLNQRIRELNVQVSEVERNNAQAENLLHAERDLEG